MQSHPTWVRGLKLKKKDKIELVPRVAPYVGAWIETAEFDAIGMEATVAPYVGAWIETRHPCGRCCRWLVAPYVGAWIETSTLSASLRSSASHPTWVRGLKLQRGI